MSCCCGEKTLKVYRGYPTNFDDIKWLMVVTKSEIPTNGWSARFEVGGIVKTYDNITPSFSVNLTAEETETLKNGLQNGTIVFVDAEGNDHPIATDLPIMVSDWVEGDIELDGFTYNAMIELGEDNVIEINIFGAKPTQELINIVDDKINEHNTSETAHAYIQGLIKDESTARKESDNYIEGKIDEHIADFDNPHRVSKAQVGLGNVDNTSDADKPVSTAQEQAIKAIQDDLDSKATALGNRIDDEATARADADTTLQSNIDAESKDRKDADTALGKRIDSEAKAREEADSLLSGKISAETNRATNAENDLQSKITAEATARADADTTLGGRIDDETSARETADSGLSERITTNTNSITSINEELDTFGNIVTHNVSEFATSAQGSKADTALQPSALIPYRTADEQDAIDATKQNVISDLDTIRTNASTGAGLKPRVESNTASITTINGKIPTQASTTNQLADKDFVNSSINNVSAYYITKNAAGDPFATKAELTGATVFYSGGVVRVPTRNDYCVVLADESHKDESTGESPTTRYIYEGQWEFQYIVNNTALTAEQLSAVNSGITSELVSAYSAHIANKENPHGVNKTQVGLGNVQNVDTTNANNITGGTLSNDRLGTIPYAKLSGVQATIPDLSTIRTNATAGKNASDTIATYGDIVTHDTDEFANSAQGAKADNSVQKTGTNQMDSDANIVFQKTKTSGVTEITTTVNIDGDGLLFGFSAGGMKVGQLKMLAAKSGIGIATWHDLTSEGLMLTPSGITNITVDDNGKFTYGTSVSTPNKSGTVALTSDLDPYRTASAQDEIDTAIRNAIPTNNNQLTNGAGYITESALSPYAKTADVNTALSGKQDTLTTAQLNAVNSGITSAKVEKYDGYEATITDAQEDIAQNIADIASLQTSKQDKISDLDTIRAGASKGETAVQPSAIADMATKTWVGQQGYLTSITSAQVVGALGYTPYSSTNPNGYQTSAQVQSAISGKANTSDLSVLALSSNVDVSGVTTGQGLIWNGTKWTNGNVSASVSFSDITGNITDNASAKTALAAKVDKSNLVSAHAVIDSYISSDGLSWYRIYDDGFIMQGGSHIFSFGGNNTNYWFTFPKPFSTTNYAFLRSNRGNTNDGGIRFMLGYQYDRKETTRIGMFVDSAAFSQGFDWIAWGK